MFTCNTAYCWAGWVEVHGGKKQGRNVSNSDFARDALWPQESKSTQTVLIRTHLCRSCKVTIPSRRILLLSFARCVYVIKRSFSRLVVHMGRIPFCPSFLNYSVSLGEGVVVGLNAEHDLICSGNTASNLLKSEVRFQI